MVLTDFLLSLEMNKYLILAMVMVMIFLLGWPLEWVPIVLIIIPIILPLIDELGFDQAINYKSDDFRNLLKAATPKNKVKHRKQRYKDDSNITLK